MWRLSYRFAVLFVILIFFLTGCGINKNQENGINDTTYKINRNVEFSYNLNNAPKFGLQAIYFINGKDGWAGGQGIILSTNDGGKNWTVEHTGSFNIIGFDFANSIYGWAISSDRSILKTTDGGKTWIELPKMNVNIENIKFVTVDRGYGTHEGKLYITNDGGQTWESINTKIKIDSYDFVDQYHGFASYNNSIYYTRDGGISWNFVYNPYLQGQWTVEIYALDVNNIWAVYRGKWTSAEEQPYLVLKTSDGGKNWTALAEEKNFSSFYGSHKTNNFLGSYLSSIDIVDKETAFAIGLNPKNDSDKFLISRTTDGGNTWSSYPVPQFDLESIIEGPIPMTFVDTYNGWIASTKNGNGLILNTLDGGQTWQQQYPIRKDNNQKNIEYVNPIIIDALKDIESNAIIKIYAPTVVPLPEDKKNMYVTAVPEMGKFNDSYNVDLIISDKTYDLKNTKIDSANIDANDILGDFGGFLFASDIDAENYVNAIRQNNGFIVDKQSQKLDYKDFIWGEVYQGKGKYSVQWREGRWTVEVNSPDKPQIDLAKQMVKYLQNYNLPVPLNKGLIVVNVSKNKTTTNIYWTKESSVYYINYNFKPVDALQMAVSMKEN
ncbi:photosystem II stability/assembly factor-like protein [Thermoanaerobacterium sp. PSU-2]|uniref:photosystem II stability/assembly factor-like protein n=1 Tax=Thermoanaerobacterium sp. PSU-2 TaxID=1930849 RepID=UPI000A15A551|nr:photosystem II stability/assembly factor-like protein [Thermoanaerobacterium sp. PSU-2]ORX23047.1 photosystem II stability/assembly factor-like protein [Thermoanaerobacterium sp. PSU-2]